MRCTTLCTPEIQTVEAEIESQVIAHHRFEGIRKVYVTFWQSEKVELFDEFRQRCFTSLATEIDKIPGRTFGELLETFIKPTVGAGVSKSTTRGSSHRRLDNPKSRA